MDARFFTATETETKSDQQITDMLNARIGNSKFSPAAKENAAKWLKNRNAKLSDIGGSEYLRIEFTGRDFDYVLFIYPNNGVLSRTKSKDSRKYLSDDYSLMQDDKLILHHDATTLYKLLATFSVVDPTKTITPRM